MCGFQRVRASSRYHRISSGNPNVTLAAKTSQNGQKQNNYPMRPIALDMRSIADKLLHASQVSLSSCLVFF